MQFSGLFWNPCLSVTVFNATLKLSFSGLYLLHYSDCTKNNLFLDSFIHSFIRSINEDILSSYYMLSLVQDAGALIKNRVNKFSALPMFTF